MDNAQTPTNKALDPFGRMIPDDGSQTRFRDMANTTMLEAAVGPTDDNRPDDIAKTEVMLNRIGLLDLRETEGPTGYYGERLRQAITALQRQSGLTETGRIVPNDPTHMALQKTAAGSDQKAADVNQPHIPVDMG
ncbi:MAG: peptidoglycan-binding protein [Rhodospirillales bacterium]|nr:peptidoglycan-binding protein [Rhodospirillales bacterium]